MFTELMPLLKQRVLVVTISHVEDEIICVSVIPSEGPFSAAEWFFVRPRFVLRPDLASCPTPFQ